MPKSTSFTNILRDRYQSVFARLRSSSSPETAPGAAMCPLRVVLVLSVCSAVFCEPIRNPQGRLQSVSVYPEQTPGPNSTEARFLMSAIGNLLLAPFGDFFPIEIDVPGTAGSLYNGVTGYFNNLITGFFTPSRPAGTSMSNKKKKIKRPHKKFATPRWNN